MYNIRTVMADIYENRRLRLRQLIEERFEWNQSKFAKALGLSRGAINDYACGAKTIGERYMAGARRATAPASAAGPG